MTEAVRLSTVAKCLDCHVDTVRRMIARGELPAFKVGTQWRVPIEALIKLGIFGRRE